MPELIEISGLDGLGDPSGPLRVNEPSEGRLSIVRLSSRQQRIQGLIGLKPIPKRVLFVFPDIPQNQTFHSKGVLEPFEIVFIDKNGIIIEAQLVTPPNETVKAPDGAVTAVEMKGGMLKKLMLEEGLPLKV
jgi:uncharacterized membrane protein (UPF0127 family)